MDTVKKNKEIHTVSLSELFQSFEKSLGFKNKIKWNIAIMIILYHIIGVYWSYKYAFPAKWQTLAFALAMYIFGGFGLIVGVHKLWTHRAFKVNLPLHLMLLAAFASAGQNTIYQWVLDHRVHHKYSDTEADPHNSNRGLFFSHIGWLMTKKNEQVLSRGKQIDMSDITDDPLLRFYNRYFTYFKLLFCYILPFCINVYLLGETWQCTIAWQWFIRFLFLFHGELTVNSLAHAFGSRPYNKEIVPTQSIIVSLLTFGEGGHNFHHAFPYDYRSVEQFDYINLARIVIDLFSKIGWAYDLRAATPAMINSLSQRLGDGTRINRSPNVEPEKINPHWSSVVLGSKVKLRSFPYMEKRPMPNIGILQAESYNRYRKTFINCFWISNNKEYVLALECNLKYSLNNIPIQNLCVQNKIFAITANLF